MRGVLNKNFLSSLNKIITNYQRFINLTEEDLRSSFNLNDSIINVHTILSEIGHTNIIRKIQELIVDSDDYERTEIIFLLNLRVSYWDYNFIITNETLSELSDTLVSLMHIKINTSPVVKILIDKIKYLLYKIKKRNLSTHETIFSVDGTNINIDDVEYYKNFKILTDEAYVPHITQQNVLDFYNSFLTYGLRGDSAIINFNKTHLVSKFFHTTTPISEGNLIKSENLHKRLTRAAVNSEFNIFNQYAVKSLANLLYNNYIKCLVKFFIECINTGNNEKVKIYKIKICNSPEYIKKFQEIFEIADYKPYELILKGFSYFLLIQLENNTYENVEDLNKDLEIFLPVFTTYYKNIQWVKKKKFLPLYLPDTECLHTDVKVKINQSSGNAFTVSDFTNFDLFLDSSYILPLDISKIENEYDELYEKIKINSNLLTNKIIQITKQSIRVEVHKDLEVERKIAEERISTNQVRNVEVLSLFSAVLAFILVGVSTLKQFDDFVVMFLFMLGMSICLLIFVVTIDYILHKQKVKISLIRLIFSLVTLLIIITFFKTCNIIPNIPIDSKSYIKDTSLFRKSIESTLLDSVDKIRIQDSLYHLKDTMVNK